MSDATSTLSCYPHELVETARWWSLIYVSPGVCPAGYKTVGTVLTGAETRAYCCPSYVVRFLYRGLGQQLTLSRAFQITKGEPYWEDVTCSSSVGSSTRIVWDSDEVATASNGSDIIIAHWSTTWMSVNSALATAVIAAWRSIDLPRFTPASAPVLRLTESSPPSLNISTIYSPPSSTTPSISTASFSSTRSGATGDQFSDATYTPWTPSSQSIPTATTSGSSVKRCGPRIKHAVLAMLLVTLLIS
jgi:hypothetical protein